MLEIIGSQQRFLCLLFSEFNQPYNDYHILNYDKARHTHTHTRSLAVCLQSLLDTRADIVDKYRTHTKQQWQRQATLATRMKYSLTFLCVELNWRIRHYQRHIIHAPTTKISKIPFIFCRH